MAQHNGEKMDIDIKSITKKRVLGIHRQKNILAAIK
jgi:hypothetical protein